ncbi:MAG: hydroxymethylpyrimidine/phosphomethylpyrimidine kinase [Bacteroidetes bacterium]|nr:hydroxymethylpyrimidine/phosphomethylpyrimidine kinase [Bacteroidota bacterium]
MPTKRPYLLSIAGFDPSGGAGVLADIKTFEAHKTYGLAVITGNTIQNENTFESVEWVDLTTIEKQIKILFSSYPIEYAKIGIVSGLEMLSSIIAILKSLNPTIKIIWDPIIKASAGFEFFTPSLTLPLNKGEMSVPSDRGGILENILKQVYLITPNWNELKQLTGNDNAEVGAKELSRYCNVFLKGGHNEDNKGKDYLYTTDGKYYPFKAKQISEYPKHGSGCVLSAATTALLGKGYNLQRSCLMGKGYITHYLNTSKTLLGYHKI